MEQLKSVFALGFISFLVGCLPQSDGTPLEQCAASEGEGCTCSNGLSGELSCEAGQLYCVCGVLGGDMSVDASMPDDGLVLDQGADMSVVMPDIGGDMAMADMQDEEEMGGEEVLCEGVPCTCETGALPEGWSSEDVGDVMIAGSAGTLDGEWCVEASGRDIYGTEDGFHFVHRQVSGDVDIVARLEAFGGVDPWSKLGVMIREDTTGGSRYAATLTTVDNGSMLFQRAMTAGDSAQTDWTSGVAFSAPVWVRLTRRGDVFEGATSTDGVSWTVLGESMTLSGFGPEARVGLAVTSHDNTLAVKAKFSRVEVIER